MSNSPESCVSTQDTFRVMEKEVQTSSVSALVSRLNTCSVTDYGAGDKSDDTKSFGDDGQKDDKSMADIFPWLPKINDLCRSAVGSKNIKTLENLLTVYLQKVTSSVKDCYLKPIRAGKLKTCMNETLTFFHFLYEDIKEAVDNTLYLEKMTELMAMYIDMEIKSSRRRKESPRKVISRVTSALNIFLDQSENHILDAIMRAKYITTTDKEICSPVLEKLLKSLRTYDMQDTLYVRYLLVYKLWKKIVADAAQRKEINKLAIARLPPPANFADRYKRFNNVLPRMPNSKNITTFYMQAKLNIKTACKNFMKISKDPMQPVVIDKPLFFDGRPQTTFSGKGNAFDGGVSRNLMNEIWSSYSEDNSSSKKKDSCKKKSKAAQKNLADKKKKRKSKCDSFSDSNSPHVETAGKDAATPMDVVTSSANDVPTSPAFEVAVKERQSTDARVNVRDFATFAQHKLDVNLPDSTTAQMSHVPQADRSQFGHFAPLVGSSSEVASPYDCALAARLYEEDQKPFAVGSNVHTSPGGMASMFNNTRTTPQAPKEENISSSRGSNVYNQECDMPLQSSLAPHQKLDSVSRVLIKMEDNNNMYQPKQESPNPPVADPRTQSAPKLDITGPFLAMKPRNIVPVITIDDSTDAEKEEEFFKESDIQSDQDLPYIEEEVVEPCADSFAEEIKVECEEKEEALDFEDVEYNTKDYPLAFGYVNRASDSVKTCYNDRYSDRPDRCQDKLGNVVDSNLAVKSTFGAIGVKDMSKLCQQVPPPAAVSSKPHPATSAYGSSRHPKPLPSSSQVSSSHPHRRPQVDAETPTRADLLVDSSHDRSRGFVSPPPEVRAPTSVASKSPPKVQSPPMLTSPRRHRRSETDIGARLPVSPRGDSRSAPGFISTLSDRPVQSPSPQLKMLTSPKSVVVKSSKPMVLSSSLESAVMQSPQAMVFSSPPPKAEAAFPEPPVLSPPQVSEALYAAEFAAVSQPPPVEMQPMLFVSPETVAMPPPRPVARPLSDPVAFTLHGSQAKYSPSVAAPQVPHKPSLASLPDGSLQLGTASQACEMLPTQQHHQDLYAPHHNQYLPNLVDSFSVQDDFKFSPDILPLSCAGDILSMEDDFFYDYLNGRVQDYTLVDPNEIDKRSALDDDIFQVPFSFMNAMDMNTRAHEHLLHHEEHQPSTRWPYDGLLANPTEMPHAMPQEDEATAYQHFPLDTNAYQPQRSSRDCHVSAGGSSDVANTLPSNGLSADTSQYNPLFRNSISETCDTDALGHSSQMTKAHNNSVNCGGSYRNENAHSSLRTHDESRDFRSSHRSKADSGLSNAATSPPDVHKTSSLPFKTSELASCARVSLQEISAPLNGSVQLAQVNHGDIRTAAATKPVAPRGGPKKNSGNTESRGIKRAISPSPTHPSMSFSGTKSDVFLGVNGSDFEDLVDSDFSPEKKDSNKRPVTRSTSKETPLMRDSALTSGSRRKSRKIK